MFLNTIRVVNFRNLQPFSLRLHEGVNVFIGSNAQGKTNVLEAASLLSDGRSFRCARISEMIQFGTDQAIVEGEIRIQDREYRLQIKFTKNGRMYFVNGKQTSDLRDYLGKVYFVVFSAEFLNISEGDPRIRRDFLDRCIFSLTPSYLILIREYQRILKSRNLLLRSDVIDHQLLNTYTDQLVEYGSRMVRSRLMILEKLLPKAQKIHQMISAEQEQLDLGYQSSFVDQKYIRENGLSFTQSGRNTDSAIVNHASQSFGRERKNEIARKTTLVGPHRDEMSLSIDGRDVRHYGSRGQKRTAVMALKLAELQLYQDEHGDNPVLIFDDIASELDRKRQQLLLNMIPQDIQVLISHTDFLSSITQQKIYYFTVNKGTIMASDEIGSLRNSE